ncbi:HIT family protein [Acetobacter pasteurianus]|uniref:Adenosine 5'-monophosphoramidase HNT1 n=1 Tax=Lodderomyces elongisporus (strain ATCC 11503 / CBS 2605 / JCM 1781 / NBRC 1676 / NRRL YB-4239) TaxID=379508 RepID=A5DSQ4_LODEL|nr:Adenosine 5'-monophosphoramidase [Lodderomyces elongisporus]EDK42212.1 hit family protein 1 [Lodderomyces elongisporus NRRL YB-4239]MDC6271113.1 HIT family protein [Acetobacter pasteurianus]WLF76678.1 Adenosine 5'-monophosphoramidase [Lodderomyces elongisporus]
MAASNASCIFCKIIKGEIPSLKLIETKLSYSFLDIQPTAEGHVLVIPKYHGAKLHNIPDEYLSDILPVVKKLTHVLKLDDNNTPEGEGYNILQNNGRIAHQVVDHVHFHLIPKRDEETGLGVGWPAQETNFDKLNKLHEKLKKELEQYETEKL